MDHQQNTAALCVIAKQLLRISNSLNQLYADQLALVSHITTQNMFKIDQSLQRISLAGDLFFIQFNTPKFEGFKAILAQPLMQLNFMHEGQHAEALEDFFLHELYFLTGDRKPQHSLLLRSKAQQIRQLLVDQIYQWCCVEVRAEAFLQGITQVQAEITDHLMIKAKLYKTPVLQQFLRQAKPLPEEVKELFKQMFKFELLIDGEFLPIQPLMESLDEFCYTAVQFLDIKVYRIMALCFEERFNLHELQEHRDDILLMFPHAAGQPALLGFLRIMHREVWPQQSILNKQNFLQPNTQVWQKKAAKLPLFDNTRAVNWLYRQSAEVADWVSENIQHSSVRVAITAMSFIDSSRQHPQMILAALQYFQYVAARMFIYRCHDLAIQEHWFDRPVNAHAVLQGTKQSIDDNRIAISHSILYLDEWMALLRSIATEDETAFKRVYLNLSRVIQAYLQHLEKVCRDLPADLMAFIRVENQQNRDFHLTLRRHRIQLDDFRQLFYLQYERVRESIYDAYVRDYLGVYFAENKPVPKTVTWAGLFQQATRWHDDIQKEEIMSKLRRDCASEQWQAVTEEGLVEFEGWRFEELVSIDRIIEESKIFRHCLAASYAHRIVEGDYTAFHVTQGSAAQMTLGCMLLGGELYYDQLEYPNNEKAEAQAIERAKRFIFWQNQKRKKRLDS